MKNDRGATLSHVPATNPPETSQQLRLRQKGGASSVPIENLSQVQSFLSGSLEA